MALDGGTVHIIQEDGEPYMDVVLKGKTPGPPRLQLTRTLTPTRTLALALNLSLSLSPALALALTPTPTLTPTLTRSQRELPKLVTHGAERRRPAAGPPRLQLTPTPTLTPAPTLTPTLPLALTPTPTPGHRLGGRQRDGVVGEGHRRARGLRHARAAPRRLRTVVSRRYMESYLGP